MLPLGSHACARDLATPGIFAAFLDSIQVRKTGAALVGSVGRLVHTPRGIAVCAPVIYTPACAAPTSV